MNAPSYENKITLGNIAIVVGLAATLWGAAAAWGDSNRKHEDMNRRMLAVEALSERARSDRELLIELRTDLRYLKQAVDEIRAR